MQFHTANGIKELITEVRHLREKVESLDDQFKQVIGEKRSTHKEIIAQL